MFKGGTAGVGRLVNSLDFWFAICGFFVLDYMWEGLWAIGIFCNY